MRGIGPVELVLVFLGMVVVVLPFWKIFSKAGYPGPLGLLILVPVVNALVPFFLAFAEWPVERELRRLQGR